MFLSFPSNAVRNILESSWFHFGTNGTFPLKGKKKHFPKDLDLWIWLLFPVCGSLNALGVSSPGELLNGNYVYSDYSGHPLIVRVSGRNGGYGQKVDLIKSAASVVAIVLTALQIRIFLTILPLFPGKFSEGLNFASPPCSACWSECKWGEFVQVWFVCKRELHHPLPRSSNGASKAPFKSFKRWIRLSCC